MHTLSYIIWNFDPELYSGTPTIRWYGLFFALGFLLSQQVLFYIYKNESDGSIEAKKNAERLVENMTVYMIIATILGARLGHVIFYQPQDYFTSFEGIIRIFNIREGGLASHGAAISIILVLYLFANYRFNIKEGKLSKLFFLKTDRGYNQLQIMDRIVIVVALTGALIRFGNFTNSEIIGIPTESEKGVVFARDITDLFITHSAQNGYVEKIDYRKNDKASLNAAGHVPIYIYIEFKKRNYERADLVNYLETVNGLLSGRWADKHIDEPITHKLDYDLVQGSDGSYTARIATFGIARHPAQLYESISTFLLFVILMLIWRIKRRETMPGLLFSVFFILLFTARFFHEFIKENQVAFEDDLTLNMGQWLSIPMVLLGVITLLIQIKRTKNQGTGS